MSDPKKGGDAPPPSGSGAGTGVGDTPDGRLDAELDSIAELLDSGFGEALGDLLGPPPPLPPPPSEPVATVGARPTRTPTAPPILPAAQVPPAPTDEEVFGNVGGSSEFDEAFARATAETRRAQPKSEAPFEDATRITEIDGSLLEKARPTDETYDRQSVQPTPTPARRGPAIVRRERLSREMPSSRGEEYSGENATVIAEPGYGLRQLEVAALAEEEPPAPPAAELDESFYDGIEIGASDEAPAAPPPAPVSVSVPAVRRVTRNVVRRGSTEISRVVTPVAPAGAEPPSVIVAEPPGEGEEGIVLEAGEPGDSGDAEAAEFLGRTGIYVRPDEAHGEVQSGASARLPGDEASDGGGRVAGEVHDRPARAVPLALEAAIDESVEPDGAGSNPLVDVFADLGLEEPESGAPNEPLTGDLSIDLEGEVEESAWSDEPVGSLEEELFRDDGAGEAARADEGDSDSDAEAAIDAALAEPPDGGDTVVGPAPTAARAAHDISEQTVVEPVGETTVVAPMPLGLGADPSIDPAAFKLPEKGPPLVASDEGAALADLEKEIEHHLGLPVGETSPEHSARLHLYAGLAAERAGDAEKAIEHLDEAAHADDRSLASVRALRRLLFKRGLFQEALRWLDRELGLAGPAERDALAAFRADVLLAVGEQDLARVAYGELVDLRPDDLRSLLAQVELAYSDERDDELLDVLGAAARHVNDPELVAAMAVLRARIFERQARSDLAASGYEDALAANAAERTAHLGLARLALRGGRDADAALHHGAFLAGSSDPSLLAAAARRRAAHAAPADALQALEETGAVGDPLVLEAMADNYARTEQHAELALALSGWGQAEPSPGRRADIYLRLAAVQAGPLGDAAAAVRTLADVAQLDRDDGDVAEELIASHLAAGDTDAAVALLRTAAEADPQAAPWSRLRAARILEAAGRAEEAVAELGVAAEGAPVQPIFVEATARALTAAGQTGVLASFLAATADDAAADPVAARERAARAADELARAGGDPADAEEAWRAVLAVEPAAGAAHAALVRWAQHRGDPAALAEALAGERAASRDPARQAAIAIRRAALLAPVAARAALEEVLGADALDPRATERLVLLAGREGRFGDVADAYAARAEALPDGVEKDVLRYRAAALLQDEEADHARAAELVGPTAAALPGYAGAALRLERAHRQLGDGSAIASDLEREAKDDSASPDVRAARWVRLAETVAARVGDMPRAAAAYREAIALRPDDPAVRDGFGRVAVAAHEVAPLADLALADLRRAEERNDLAKKVAAYEELARVDGDLRGDIASATLAWESATALDPSRLPALRALERTYLGEKRTAELDGVYAKLGTALAASPADAGPVVLERARLLDKAGQVGEAAIVHRDALAIGTSRMSLFKLETRARDAKAIEELAGLDEQIAAYFAGTAGQVDGRGQAAFLVRAGEALADLDRPEEAIRRFRAAAEALPGYVPALRAWRRTALASGRWHDLLEAAEREAAAARSDAERARLLHLVGVAAMDRAGEPSRAVAALRHVLALDPRHDDAFRRLRRLYDAAGEHAALAELLAARVEIETHPGRLVEQHATLATLYRDRLIDPERAKAHLRAVLARDPQNLDAVASLSDIAWTQGQWSEAAEALIVRAKLEKDPQILKEVFFRLGVIYAEKLPDRRWATKSFERVLSFDPNDLRALEHLSTLSIAGGEWRQALAATERLVSLDSTPAARVLHLQRIARILEEGYQDRKRAEEALRRATEADPGSTEALGAIVDFYTRVNDGASLRVNLDRIAANMRSRLASDPYDGVSYRVLGRTLLARSAAGIAGSAAPGRAAAELAVAFGAGDDEDRATAAEQQASARGQGGFARGLGGLAIDDQLFHPSIPNGFRQIFRLLHETLSKRFPADLRRAGVGKGDRLPRTGHPVREVVARLAGEVGVADFDIYVSSARPNIVAIEITDPWSITLGAQIVALGPAEVRFAAARAMKLALSYMGVPALLGPEELGVLLAAVIRQYDPAFAPLGVNPAAVSEETQRLARLIPKRMRDEIQRFAAEVSGVAFDRHGLWLGVQHTGNRAGLLASGSALAALNVLVRTGGHAGVLAARGDVQIDELLRFAVSNEHAEIRAAIDGA